MTSNPDAPPAEQLLTVKGVAALLALSERSIWKLTAAGRMPAPIRLGRAVRWRLGDLHQWIAAGCPARERWQEIRGGNAK